MRSFIFALLLLSHSMAFAEPRIRPDTWARPVIDTELENFHRVDDGLYRAGQPDDDDFADMKSLGIKEILNLREFHSDDEAKEHKFRVHRVKMDAGEVTAAQLLEALKYIKNREGPLLVHCWHGSDRTGATIAAYRMVFQNWDRQQAIDEMVNGGYGHHETIYDNLPELLKTLDVEKMRRELGLSAADL